MQQASNNGLVNRLSLTVSNSSTEVGLASETRSTSVAWKLTCKLYVNTSFKSYRSDGSFVARSSCCWEAHYKVMLDGAWEQVAN